MNHIFKGHTFHIPVMGIGFSIDTPIKVAPYGISSAISLIDDSLMEKMREFYSRKFNVPYQPIPRRQQDFRAERITAYLNLVNGIVREKFGKLKASCLEKGSEFEKYIQMLPDFSNLKKKYKEALAECSPSDLKKWVQEHLHPGSVDVNIMTKLDVENFQDGEKLPVEFNDAHAALRGFANSDLESSIILSAGLNPRLYSYLEQFPDFFPNEKGELKKKVILKTSDYRSAFIQGKFLAKKGIWVSEFRVESGLNCGGHAFASDGYLLGPILEEFRLHRDDLINTVFETWVRALQEKSLPIPPTAPQVRITAQGGVGTYEEHQFLIDHYGLDSIGWGSPFLLVPEATCVDSETMDLLGKAGEDDLYLSQISPLGVPFNSVRGNGQDRHKEELIHLGKPGSGCPKEYCRLNREFPGKPLCTASSAYQALKTDKIKSLNLPAGEENARIAEVNDKACLCIGLSESALIVNSEGVLPTRTGVSVCPGPNMAYFTKVASLREMVDHIYGRTNLITATSRPNFLLKELALYIDYLRSKVVDPLRKSGDGSEKYLELFRNNLKEGIAYYRNEIFNHQFHFFDPVEACIQTLDVQESELLALEI